MFNIDYHVATLSMSGEFHEYQSERYGALRMREFLLQVIPHPSTNVISCLRQAVKKDIVTETALFCAI